MTDTANAGGDGRDGRDDGDGIGHDPAPAGPAERHPGDESDAHDDRGDDHPAHDGHGHDRDGRHDHHAHDRSAVEVAVVTVSTSRSLDDDPAGDAVADALTDDGHTVSHRELIADDFDGVQGTVDRIVNREDVQAVVLTGGTGVTPDDVTVEAIAPLLEKKLPGFGELFRRLSFDEIGTRVVGTRADAGIADGAPVFCLPGSENAARLGAAEIIVPELGHLTGLARRDE